MAYYRTSTRKYRIISAAAQKPNPNPCGPGSVPLCTIGMRALSKSISRIRHLLYCEVMVYCTGRLSQTGTVLAYA